MMSLAPLVALALPLLAGPVAAGEQWSRFRGPNGAGVCEEAPLPAALDRGKNLLWERELEPGLSSPCLWEERLFVTGASAAELVTVCLDRRDGKVLWKRGVPVERLERSHEINGPASPTPTTDGKRVLVYFGSFGLLAYDLDGQELWRRPLPIPENTFGTASSPIFAGERAFFVSDANDSSFLEALDPADGKVIWRRERTGFVSGWSTPALWSNGGRQELLVYGAFRLTGYDPADGRELWSVPGLADEPIVTPVTSGELVFVTSFNLKTNPEAILLSSWESVLADHDHDQSGTLDASEAAENESVLSRHDADGEGDHPLSIFFRFLDVDKDGAITAEEWKKLVAWVESWTHANGLLAIRPGSSEHPAEIAWQFPRGVPECPSPLAYRGRIYMVMNGGLLTCVDARSGAEIFQGRLEARGPYYASLVAGDGKIYAASARGELTVLAAKDELEVLSRLELGERVMATPALGAGCVFVRTEERVLAFGAED